MSVEVYSGLQTCVIEGIEALSNKFQNIFHAIKKKQYDVLDHRKPEFDRDYDEYQKYIADLEVIWCHYYAIFIRFSVLINVFSKTTVNSMLTFTEFTPQSNRNVCVFSRNVKLVKLPISLSSVGSLFQIRGSSTLNDLFPSLVLVRGMTCIGRPRLMMSCRHELTRVRQIGRRKRVQGLKHQCAQIDKKPSCH